MRMETDRKTMIAVLKRSFVPTLRALGFKGSFPNFFRVTEDFVALANVQFSGAGGSFCVNLSYAGPGRSNIFFEPETEPEKMRISQTRDRLRLGAATTGGDHWFVFGSASATPYRGSVLPPEEIVAQCNALLASQAVEWWASKAGNRGQ